MQPPMIPPPPVIPPPPPATVYPGTVLFTGKEEDFVTQIALDGQTHKDITIHVFNEAGGVGASLACHWNFWSDQWQSAYGHEVDVPDKVQAQFELLCSATRRAQHYTYRVPPGVKALSVGVANYVAGKFTVSISKR